MEQAMPTEYQIIMAAEAIKALVPLGYGMTWEEAKGYAEAALIAAAQCRTDLKQVSEDRS